MIQRFLIMSLVLIIGLTILPSSQAQTPPSLQSAISSGQVSARFFGTGGSSGDSVMVEVSKGPKAPSGPLTVSVPPGSKLASGDAGAQSMIIIGVTGRSTGGNSYVPTGDILVPATGSSRYILNAFCAEFEKDNPSTSTTFSLRPADTTTACIAQQSTKAGLSIEATQAAIWIHTDRISYEHMNEKFDISRADWDRAVRVAAACGVSQR